MFQAIGNVFGRVPKRSRERSRGQGTRRDRLHRRSNQRGQRRLVERKGTMKFKSTSQTMFRALILTTAVVLTVWFSIFCVNVTRWSEQSSCDTRLYQLRYALESYHSSYGRLPVSPSGTPNAKHSWRVFVVADAWEFRDYNMDEPWDSPGNLVFAMKMPEWIRCPSARPNAKREFDSCNYHLLVREESHSSEHEDHASLSIEYAIVELNLKPIPWTAPTPVLSFMENGDFSYMFHCSHPDGCGCAGAGKKIRRIRSPAQIRWKRLAVSKN